MDRLKEAQLQELLQQVTLPCEGKRQEATDILDGLFKPIAGLGLLEGVLTQIAAIQQKVEIEVRKKAVIVMCADNGVVEEGVSQTEQIITALVTKNMVTKESSVCRMCRVVGADVIPVDVGVLSDIEFTEEEIEQFGVLRTHKLAYGTKNMKLGPAMTREQAVEGIGVGIQVVKELKDKGYHVIGTGEMGIANTTTSSAIASVLLQQPVEVVTGRGAGLTRAGIDNKVQVIKEAIKINEPNTQDPLDILSKLGGFDIAGLVGVCLGAAIYQMPVVLDGLIAGVAALLAIALCKETRAYMIPSHMGKEPASQLLMKELGMKPVIHGELALGEGTGVALFFPMLDMALSVYQMSNTFAGYDVEAYERYEETV